jgi:hypothetical protein
VIANKFNNEKEKAQKFLEAEDWSSTADKFQLAVAVLSEDFDRAAEIMKQIGPERQPGPFEYREWPLFNECRSTNQFLTTYNKIFSEEFKLQEKEQKKAASERKNKDNKEAAEPANQPDAD